LPALGKGISAGVKYTTLKLRNSSLNSESGILILHSMIKKNIKCLDLSLNPLMSKKFYLELADTFDNQEFNLEELHLEGNKMKDDFCEIICKKISMKPSMKVLNLSHNCLTDKAAPALVSVVNNCVNLAELHIAYNQIFSEGSTLIANEIMENYSLKILDISFNSICGLKGKVA